MLGVIYVYREVATGKIRYAGQTTEDDPQDRDDQHFANYDGTAFDTLYQRDRSKYKMSIVETLEEPEEDSLQAVLDAREIALIAKHNLYHDIHGLNFTTGGTIDTVVARWHAIQKWFRISWHHVWRPLCKRFLHNNPGKDLMDVGDRFPQSIIVSPDILLTEKLAKRDEDGTVHVEFGRFLRSARRKHIKVYDESIRAELKEMGLVFGVKKCDSNKERSQRVRVFKADTCPWRNKCDHNSCSAAAKKLKLSHPTSIWRARNRAVASDDNKGTYTAKSGQEWTVQALE